MTGDLPTSGWAEVLYDYIANMRDVITSLSTKDGGVWIPRNCLLFRPNKVIDTKGLAGCWNKLMEGVVTHGLSVPMDTKGVRHVADAVNELCADMNGLNSAMMASIHQQVYMGIALMSHAKRRHIQKARVLRSDVAAKCQDPFLGTRPMLVHTGNTLPVHIPYRGSARDRASQASFDAAIRILIGQLGWAPPECARENRRAIHTLCKLVSNRSGAPLLSSTLNPVIKRKRQEAGGNDADSDVEWDTPTEAEDQDERKRGDPGPQEQELESRRASKRQRTGYDGTSHRQLTTDSTTRGTFDMKLSDVEGRT